MGMTNRRRTLRAMTDGGRTVSKPIVGPDGQTFEDFDACVATFEDEPSIDDPEAFCSWLEEEGKDALADPNANELLTGLEVEFVSAVDVPAQDSEWLIAKDAADPDGETHRWRSDAPIVMRPTDDVDEDVVKADEDKQIAFAPVLIPGEADKQGDVIPDHEIEKAAHTYLSEFRKVDSDHDLLDGRGTPVESWTLKKDMSFTKPDGDVSREYPKGTWILGIKFDDETWSRVKQGELQGLSIYGGARPIDVDALIDGTGKAANDRSQSMKNEDDDEDDVDKGADTPDDDVDGADDEQVTKQIDAGVVSSFLETLGDKESLSGDSTVKEFVLQLIEDGDVDETEVRNMAVLLNNDGDGADDGGDVGDMGDEDVADEAPDDSDVSLDEGGKSDDGDTEDTEKSVAADIDPDDVEALRERIAKLEDVVDVDEPLSDRLSDADFETRFKNFVGLDDDADDEVVRKALREQVEKGDDDSVDISFDGIADDGDDVSKSTDRTDDDETTGTADAGQSKSANTRFA